MVQLMLFSSYLKKVNVLFICSRNRLRSPTAETLFAKRAGITAASAGTSEDAENVISADLIEWADIIFAMETVHKRKLGKKYASLLKTRRVVVLGIPDKYDYMDEALVASLNQKVPRHLKLPIEETQSC